MKNEINVLLVDNSATILKHMKEILAKVENIGLVVTAHTLPTAQEILKAHKINVMVLDIQLPAGNGIDFLKWTRFKYPEIRVIMLSNLADDCHRAVAKNAGAYHFLDKSLEFDQLPEVLAKISEHYL
jgi:DNA-binding NarL/FixJ family response regulator